MDLTFLPSLKQMVIYCRDLQQLLDNDKSNFAENQFSLIEESNKQKSALIEQITTLTNNINHALKNYTGSLFEKVTQAMENADNSKQQEISEQLEALKTEISQCYKKIVINNSIALSGMQFLKDIWDRLLSIDKINDCTYDHLGNTR